jgi:hypothetical protein
LDDSIYYTLYIHTVRDYRQYSAIADLHTLQFTPTHALGFSVFTSRILSTDLSQSHCYFNSHMKASWHSLIFFLQFLLNYFQLPSPELCPIPILAAWGPLYIASRRTDRKHRFLYCCEGVFTAPLHSNGCYSIVASVLVAAGMFTESLPSNMYTRHNIILIFRLISLVACLLFVVCLAYLRILKKEVVS